MASCGYGMTGHLMFQFQNSMGTSLTTSLQSIPITGESIVLTVDQVAEASMYGRLGESPYHAVSQIVQGDISMEANPTAMGNLLKATLGLTSTTSATGTQTHVFEARTADFDCRAASTPVTMEIYRDVGSAAVYYDMIGNNLSLNIANGELMTVNAGFIGAGFTRKSNATPSFPVSKPFVWDQASASYNGAAIVDLRDLTIDVNNNLEAVYTLTGSKAPYRIKRTAQQQIEVSGTIVFAAHSYWQAYEAGTEAPLVVNFVSAEAPHTLKIDIPKLRFKTFEPTMGDAGLVEASFTAGAMFHTSSNNAMLITLVNTQPYY